MVTLLFALIVSATPPASFSAPIHLRAGASRRLALGILLIHVGTAAIAMTVALPGWFKLALGGALLMSLAWSWYWHILHRGDAVTEAVLYTDGTWLVTTAGRGTIPAVLASDSFAQPWLTALLFTFEDGRRRTLLLLPDNTDADAFRRLRVRLKFWPLRPS